MRKVIYGALFILLTLVFLYATFPFERFIESSLCSRGVVAQEVLFNRFPPQVVLKGVKVKGLPFQVELLKVKPNLPLKEFNYYCKVCSGTVEGKFTYPVTYFSFKASGVEVGKCYSSSVKFGGKLKGEGFFKLSQNDLTGGKGSLEGESLKLKGMAFGLFTADLLDLGSFKGSYRVIGKNLIEVEGEGSGKDADYRVSGSINFKPQSPANSYLNLKIRVKVKRGPLKGKSFSFKVRGEAANLRW